MNTFEQKLRREARRQALGDVGFALLFLALGAGIGALVTAVLA